MLVDGQVDLTRVVFSPASLKKQRPGRVQAERVTQIDLREYKPGSREGQ